RDLDRFQQTTIGREGYRDLSWTSSSKLLTRSRGIWSIDPVTGQKQFIPGTGVADLQPASGIDEHVLFFTSWRQNQSAVWRMNRDDGKLMQMTRGGSGGRPKISPDGKWLVYAAFAEDGIAIWKMPSEGGPAKRVSQGGAATDPDVSPDGRWISGRHSP